MPTRSVCAVLSAFAALLFPLSYSARSQSTPTPQTGVVVAGNARFTVVTRECIRIEQAGASGAFIDQPSMFAADREARFTGYALEQTAQSTTIDTGIIYLVYTPDGNPLGLTNLSATIRSGATTANWTAGAPNPGNLGGTVPTLDGWDGARSLGEGVLSRDGWYLLDDSKTDLLTSDWVQSRPAGAGTDWYLFGYGDDYRGALKSLTAIGGPIPLPRKYLLGAWYSRYWPYSSTEYRQIVEEYTTHDFPLDNIVLDMDWHKDGWTGWSWNRTLLPDAEDLLRDFHKQGLHVTLNVHPANGVGPQENAYAQFMRDMGEDPASGRTLPFDAGNKKYLDTLFADTHDPLVKAGVDFWWLDWQQFPYTRSIPDLTNLAWLNRCYYNYSAKGGLRGASFSRWAGWGDHRYPIHFSGDASTSWQMLAFEVPMTATAGSVGCFFWSHDIGGHNRGRNEESYTRWCQFGALSAALRSHSTRDPTMDRRPWTYADWAETSMRGSFHLRSELFPYIYTSVAEAAHDTIPLTRPLYLEYPGDENAYHNAQEYLFGDNLLVAPIVSPGVGARRVGRQVVYFPTGVWYNVFTGERYSGPVEALVSADIDEFPLYARAGTPIPLQPYSPRMTTTALTKLRVVCYPGADGQKAASSLYEDDGVTSAYLTGARATTPLTYTRKGNVVAVQIGATLGHYENQPQTRAYVVELRDTLRPSSIRVDGKRTSAAYDLATHTTKLTIAPRSIDRSVSIEAVFPGDLDYDAVAAKEARRRVGEVMGAPISGETLREIAAQSAQVADAPTREAALAACGIGLVAKDPSLYLYRGTPQWTFYAPSGALDGNAAPSVAANPPHVEFSIAGQAVSIPDRTPWKNDIAPLAHTAVTSIESAYGLAGLTDTVLGGYPDDYVAEWASDQTIGAACTLTWDTPQTVDRIRLFDRPNLVDQVTSGVLLFSDGTALTVGALPNDGQTPRELRFPAKTISHVTFLVTGVRPGTQHAGLSEFAVYAVP